MINKYNFELLPKWTNFVPVDIVNDIDNGKVWSIRRKAFHRLRFDRYLCKIIFSNLDQLCSLFIFTFFVIFTNQWRIEASVTFLKSINGLLEIRTRPCRMEGENESAGLCALAQLVKVSRHFIESIPSPKKTSPRGLVYPPQCNLLLNLRKLKVSFHYPTSNKYLVQVFFLILDKSVDQIYLSFIGNSEDLGPIGGFDTSHSHSLFKLNGRLSGLIYDLFLYRETSLIQQKRSIENFFKYLRFKFRYMRPDKIGDASKNNKCFFHRFKSLSVLPTDVPS